MRLKTNAVPEVKLTRKDGTIIKKGDAPAYIEDATFNFLAAAYANLTAENGDKAVVKIGEGKNASTILFAHDEDSNQDVLFLDGYFVTKVSVEKDEITFWRTLKSSYKSFKAKDMIANKMKEYENALEAEKNLKAAKEEVVNYFNVKKVEEPILMQARLEVKSREDKIAAIRKEIEAIKAQRAEKEAELQPLLKDKKTTQNSKEVKNLNKEIDTLKAKENAKEEAIIAINAELDGPIAVLNKKISNCKDDLAEENKKSDDKKDQNKVKALEKEIAKYEGEIAKLNQTKVITDLEKEVKTLEETRNENDRKIADAKAKLKLVNAITNDDINGKPVAVDSSLKTSYEYEKEIEGLNKDNEKIDENISQLNAKIEAAQKTAVNNLGYKDQLAAIKVECDKNLAKAAPKSALAKAKVDEIENSVKYPDGDIKIEDIAKVENEKYQIATQSFEKELKAAAADIDAKKEALRNDTIGNIYVRAQEIIEQPKYEKLYQYFNGNTPVFWGTNVTLKGKPSYGCLVVGPKLAEDKKINGKSKKEVNKTLYLVVGKTIDEVRESLPETAEDFLNIEGAAVYAADHISLKKDGSKAFIEVYKETALRKDENGNPILDSNNNKQYEVNKKKKIFTFDIRTNEEIAEFNKKEEQARKNGKKFEERIVKFVTPDKMRAIPEILGRPECLGTEVGAYVKYNYTKAKVKKPIIIAAAVLGVAALAAAVTYHYVNENNQNNAISELKDDAKGFNTNEAFEDGKKQVGNKAIDFTYDVNSNVLMTKTKSEDLTKDITPYENRNNAKGWTECGAIYQYVYNTTKNLGKDGNILMMDGASLYDEYFGDLELTTYNVGNWSLSGAPKDANGNVIADLQLTSAKEGYEAAAKDLEKTNPETAGTSAIDPQNEELNDEAQKRINKDTKGTNKAMVVDGVYVDFVNDTAFAVSEDGKNIVKLTYEDDIRTLEDAISGMGKTDTDWFTCAAANPYLPGVKYQNFYISDKTNIDGEVYSKNIIEVEKDGANYVFTASEGYKVLNTVENKMPPKNEVAYVSLVGNAAHNVEYLMVYDDKGKTITYTATTPETTEANKAGQIFNFEK